VGCFCVGVVMTEPLVNELYRRYPACWVYGRIGKGIDLMITGLPTITFHKRGKDRLTVRVGRAVLYRDQSFDRVPDLVVALVWREYTDHLRHDKTPPELPPWLVEPMASWLEYVEKQEINDAGHAYCVTMEHVAKINKHIQTMKGTV
jgi:hypothetical protein